VTDLYKVTSPKELGNTTLRGELFVPGAESHISGGMLNSNVYKSRDAQKTKGKINNVIFDVVKFKGKNVEGRPYSEKLEMLKQINKLVPELKLPELAQTTEEKKRLYEMIRDNKHPQTSEGVVIYKHNQSVPIKAKKVKDYDVEITGVFPASLGSKYDGRAIGGFLGKYEGQGPEIRIGGGLTDELREAAYMNPRKYVGRYARIKALQKFESGKFRMPTFLDWRYEKYKK
jgi:ATP-dependent DNA ligase